MAEALENVSEQNVTIDMLISFNPSTGVFWVGHPLA